MNATPSVACQCNVAPKLIFACSGASDVGEITDLTARRLANAGLAKCIVWLAWEDVCPAL